MQGKYTPFCGCLAMIAKWPKRSGAVMTGNIHIESFLMAKSRSECSFVNTAIKSPLASTRGLHCGVAGALRGLLRMLASLCSLRRPEGCELHSCRCIRCGALFREGMAFRCIVTWRNHSPRLMQRWYSHTESFGAIYITPFFIWHDTLRAHHCGIVRRCLGHSCFASQTRQLA
jgi:hypothetical protein